MREKQKGAGVTEYFHVPEWRILEWEKIYSPLNVRHEIAKMQQWLEANPRRRKKNYHRFIINWLNKNYASVATAQVQARMAAKQPAGRARYSADDLAWYAKNGIKV